jgi:tetratricopeptide (TPR) repeat protein
MGFFEWLRGSSRKNTNELLTEARALAAQSRFKDAIGVYEKIPRRVRTPRILVEVAQAYLNAGFNTSLAASYAAEALEADPNCAGAVCVQGEVLLRERRTSEALDRFEKAIRIEPSCEVAKRRIEEFRPSAPQLKDDSVTGSMPLERRPREVIGEAALAAAGLPQISNRIVSLYHQGKQTEALALAQQAVQFTLSTVGEDQPDTAGTLNNLGGLLHAIGDLAAARPCYERALAIHQKVLGEDHPKTATSLSNLGLLLEALGELAAARSYHERALAIFLKVLGEEAPGTATSLNNLGRVLRALGDVDAAQSYYERALAIRLKVLGEEHPDTVRSVNNLSALLQQKSRNR